MTTYQRVKEFHKVFGIPHADRSEHELIHGRMQLIWEECKEVFEAFGYRISTEGKLKAIGRPQSREHCLKELSDLDYVTAGTAEVFGWDFDEAGNRVHESNMSKLGDDGKPVYREDGKVLKGPNYKPPYLGDLI